MKIHVLHFEGCPHVGAARTALREALASEQLDVQIEEIDVGDPAAPPWARGWGSPTILIDGIDIAGQRPSTASACRLYAGGAPSVDAIRARIAATMKAPRGACSRRDLVAGWLAFLLWGVPIALIITGAFVPTARGALWIPSFAVMGVACLVNARQCGRLHCHVTGPLFLLGAIASVLDAFAIASLDWRLILTVIAIGTAFAFGLEWVRGRYVEPSAPHRAEDPRAP